MIAVYSRVSSDSQVTDSQDAELNRWLEREAITDFKPYSDTFTGTKMDRPGFNALMEDVDSGKIKKIVIWRLDRLGRTAAGVISLFDSLTAKGVSMVSIKDGFDLSTTTGRLLANMLASFAQFETEVRRERQAAGIEVAKQKGAYKGRKPGAFKASALRAWILRQKGNTWTDIARVLKINPGTAMRYVKQYAEKVGAKMEVQSEAINSLPEEQCPQCGHKWAIDVHGPALGERHRLCAKCRADWFGIPQAGIASSVTDNYGE